MGFGKRSDNRRFNAGAGIRASSAQFLYRHSALTGGTRLFLLFLAAGIAIFGTAAGCGKITVTYFPKFRMNPASPLFIAACIAYALTLLIPVIMNIKESVAWHYLKSKI